MYSRILVATGGSPWSEAAVMYAIALAAQTNAELRILTVLTISGVYGMPDVMSSSDLLMESVEQQGHDLLAQAAQEAAAAQVAHAVVLKWGNVSDTILQTAAEEGCDLIVLGSRGLSGFKRLMIGSISNAVAAKSPCPVLVIKQPPTVASYVPLWQRVLVATGGSPWSHTAVEHALALAQSHHLDVHLLCVEPRRPRGWESLWQATLDAKHILALAEERALAAGVSYTTTIAHGEITASILATTMDQHCDLIVLGSRGLSGWKRLMLGSISNAVAATAAVPVLVVKHFL